MILSRVTVRYQEFHAFSFAGEMWIVGGDGESPGDQVGKGL